MLLTLPGFGVWCPPWSWMAAAPRSVTHAAPDPDDFIARLKRREEPSLEEFFDRHRRGVERVLLRVLGPDPDVSDVVHDAFEQAIRSLHRFAGTPEDLGAWLNRIAINVAKNRLRHQRVRRWLRGAVPYETSEVATRVASPDVVFAMKRTYEVLQRLPADERIPFALRFIDGMQLTEIADATGTSLATVKRRLGRARERFARHAGNDAVLAEWQAGGER